MGRIQNTIAIPIYRVLPYPVIGEYGVNEGSYNGTFCRCQYRGLRAISFQRVEYTYVKAQENVSFSEISAGEKISPCSSSVVRFVEV